MKLYMMCIVSECIYLSMQLNELDLNMAALDPEVSFIQKNMSKYFVEKRVLNDIDGFNGLND
jgi:Fe-S cluster biosynthesis and repair protein YggX